LIKPFLTWLLSENPRATRTVAWLTAVMAVVSGYALYILWWEHVETRESGLTFVLGFLAAALMSFVFEFLRDVIEGVSHPWTGSRVLSTVVMLAAFELFIIAAHESAELGSNTFVGVAGFIFGAQFPRSVWSGADLLALAALWLTVALTIVFKLRTFVTRWPYPNSHARPTESLRQYLSAVAPDLRRGAWAGFRAGAIWGPIISIAYVFAFRAYSLGGFIHTNYSAWQNSLESGGALHLTGWWFLVLYIPTMIAGWFGKYFGGLGIFVGIVLVSVAAGALVSKQNRPLAIVFPSATFVFVLAAPILAAPGAWREIGWLLLLAAIIWGVPATLLGLLAPLLRRPAHHPSIWGLVASAAAVIMIVVTLTRFSSGASGTEKFLLSLATVTLLLSAFLLFRGKWSEEFWLCVALSIGMIVWGTSTLLQKVTLFRMNSVATDLIAVPLSPPQASGASSDAVANYFQTRYPQASFAPQLPDTAEFPAAPQPGDPHYFVRSCALSEYDDARTDAIKNAETTLNGISDTSGKQIADTPGTQITNILTSISAIDAVAKTNNEFRTENPEPPCQNNPLAAVLDQMPQGTFHKMSRVVPCGSENPNLLDSLIGVKPSAIATEINSEPSLSGGPVGETPIPCDTTTQIWDALPADAVALATERAALQTQQDKLQLALGQHLELTMTSSMGFWVTIALLAVWEISHPDPD
jgi:hypothetical protein